MNNVIENVSHLLSEYLSVMQQQQYKSDTWGCLQWFEEKACAFF